MCLHVCLEITKYALKMQNCAVNVLGTLLLRSWYYDLLEAGQSRD